MTTFLFANNAQSTLAGSISNTSLVCNVQAGGGALFPNPGASQQFAVTFTDAATGLVREIVYCTSRSGDTFTIVRAQEGTTALNWSANDLVANLWTAGQAAAMIQVTQAQAQTYNYAVDQGVVNAYVAVYNPPIAAPVAGMPLRFKALNTNTGASTFDPGSGAGAIRRRDGSALIGNEINAGDIIEVKWQGTYYALSGIAPATNAAVTAGTDTESAITPAQLANTSFIPPGSFLLSGALSAPNGYLLCDGTAISRTTYSGLFAAITAAAVVTITIATPAVVTWNSHGLVAGDIVSFETTGALPTGLITGTNYYVINPTTNTFQVSATPGGSAINTSGVQSGVQTCRHNPFGCGNGTTTFNLPDGKGRKLAMADLGAGRLGTSGLGMPAVMGARGGQQVNSAGVSGSASGGLSMAGSTSGSLSVSGSFGGAINASTLGLNNPGAVVFASQGGDAVSGGISGSTSGSLGVGGTASGTLGVSGGTGNFSDIDPTLVCNLFIKT